MARSVPDLALFLDAMAAKHPRSAPALGQACSAQYYLVPSRGRQPCWCCHPDFESACRDWLSREPPLVPFSQAIQPGATPLPRRVAWSATLGGLCPTEPEVAEICEQAAAWFSSLAELTDAWPDMHDASQLFQVSSLVDWQALQAALAPVQALVGGSNMSPGCTSCCSDLSCACLHRQ